MKKLIYVATLVLSTVALSSFTFDSGVAKHDTVSDRKDLATADDRKDLATADDRKDLATADARKSPKHTQDRKDLATAD